MGSGTPKINYDWFLEQTDHLSELEPAKWYYGGYYCAWCNTNHRPDANAFTATSKNIDAWYMGFEDGTGDKFLNDN